MGTPKLQDRLLAFDPTPAGLILEPLRTAEKNLWAKLRKEHFADGYYICELCAVAEERAPLIHAHEVYSYPTPKLVLLDKVIFICTRCHDAIHFERTRARCQPPYVQAITDHYCRVNGGLSEKAFKADVKECLALTLNIREYYGGAQATPTIDYGPYQDIVDEMIAKRTWRKLGLR